MNPARIRTTLLTAALLAAALSAPRPALAEPAYATEDRAAGARSERYREGQRALAEERWEDAARTFGTLVAAGGAETDAALYWRAYAEAKSGRRGDALESLRTLLSGHPESPWADDASALALELRRGRETAPALAGGDEELRLYALDALMQVEPERAVPVLERILAGDGSEKVKGRALFVLSQSDSPRAREILLRVIRTGEPARLRAEAVRMLGISGEPEDLAALAELARDPSLAPEVRAALLDAYLIADAEEPLAELARSGTDPKTRIEAIQRLGAMGATGTLRDLLDASSDATVQRTLLQALGVAGDAEGLVRFARRAKSPELFRAALQGLAIAGSERTGPLLRDLYRERADPAERRAVLQALMIQQDGATLVELFRAETDPQLRREIVRQLGLVDDPAATELLLEIVERKR